MNKQLPKQNVNYIARFEYVLFLLLLYSIHITNSDTFHNLYQ